MTALPAEALRGIIERARWAPSADNTQPWRFQLLDATACRIAYLTEVGMGVFNLDHYTGHLAMGGLFETFRLAAGATGALADIVVEQGGNVEGAFTATARIAPAQAPPDPLASVIEQRTTQRRLMSGRALPDAVKQAISDDLPPGYRVVWLQSLPDRRRLARLLSRVGKVRLLMPETFEVHRDTVAWGARYSDDRIPSDAIGADPLTRRIMAWALQSRARVTWLNRILGHWLPRLEMDYLPALACGAHFFLVGDTTADSLEHRLNHGAAMQRLWLSVTRHGMQFQPEMAALVFSRYLRARIEFTQNPAMATLMAEAADEFARLLGEADWRRVVFMGRIGKSGIVRSRSMRLPLDTVLT